ncbi:MAG: trigger factor [Tissierellia bacterium]|nr:trigger factor [Tissierellia bacterium]
MSIQMQSKENGKAVFTVDITAEEFNNAVQDAYRKNRHQFSIHGFRKGKAPRKIIEANYGSGVFYEDAVNLLLQEKYGPALEELGLDPVDYPDVDIKDEIGIDKPLTIEFTVELAPEPELINYRELTVKVKEQVVADGDVDAKVEEEREKNARLLTITDRASEEGDTLNIDFEGLIDGEPFDGGKAAGYDIILGSNTFIPGFEEQMTGHHPEDEFEVNVTFPEDYHENLKGKDAVFNVKVNSIKKKELPDVDDEFVKDVSEFDTLDEYKADIRRKLEEEASNKNRQEKINRAMEALVDNTPLTIPNAMIETQLEQELREFSQRVSSMGLDMNTYYSITQSNEEKAREELRGQAENRVKGDLILDAFIKAEEVDVTEEEIDDEIRELGKMYNEQDIDKFLQDFKEKENTQGVRDFIQRRKALDRLVEVMQFEVEED